MSTFSGTTLFFTCSAGWELGQIDSELGRGKYLGGTFSAAGCAGRLHATDSTPSALLERLSAFQHGQWSQILSGQSNPAFVSTCAQAP